MIDDRCMVDSDLLEGEERVVEEATEQFISFRLGDEPACGGEKPSGTILFDSVAAVYGDRAVCAILTGMGRDGAEGLRRVKAEGGAVIAQDEESCVVFGMPKAAIELGVVESIRPLDSIASTILSALGHSGAGKGPRT